MLVHLKNIIFYLIAVKINPFDKNFFDRFNDLYRIFAI